MAAGAVSAAIAGAVATGGLHLAPQRLSRPMDPHPGVGRRDARGGREVLDPDPFDLHPLKDLRVLRLELLHQLANTGAWSRRTRLADLGDGLTLTRQLLREPFVSLDTPPVVNDPVAEETIEPRPRRQHIP